LISRRGETGVAQTRAIDVDGLGRGVYAGQVACGACQPFRPPAGTAGEFENAASQRCASQLCLDLGNLGVPAGSSLGATVVPATTLPPIVVLGCSRSIVRCLLVEERVARICHTKLRGLVKFARRNLRVPLPSARKGASRSW
jgi:hypothetical protein